MRLKMHLTRLLIAGGLAVMTAGISQAGGANWCPCNDDPPPTRGGLIYAEAVIDAMGTLVSSILNLL